jgi:hypothetical protein
MKLSGSILLVSVTALLIGCGSAVPAPSRTPPPIAIEKADGSAPARITLSEKAVSRLGLETATASQQTVAGAPKVTVPYAAVLYDPDGTTWVYTNPEGRVFLRAAISVESIDGDVAILGSGPDAGTRVVTVGAPELYGAEHGVGGGH